MDDLITHRRAWRRALEKAKDTADTNDDENYWQHELAVFDAAFAAQTFTQAARDVLAERRRQIEVEGFTPEHDDQWPQSELATAAVCYLEGSRWRWPWNKKWWKPTTRRADLVKAGALILAEIERLDRKGSDHGE